MCPDHSSRCFQACWMLAQLQTSYTDVSVLRVNPASQVLEVLFASWPNQGLLYLLSLYGLDLLRRYIIEHNLSFFGIHPETNFCTLYLNTSYDFSCLIDVIKQKGDILCYITQKSVFLRVFKYFEQDHSTRMCAASLKKKAKWLITKKENFFIWWCLSFTDS